MFKHNFKIAFRNLFKYKTYSALNIVGLALGMTCAMYIFLWIYGELNYDQFHKNKDNLYEVLWYRKGSDGKPFISSGLPSPVMAAILQETPDVIAATRTNEPTASIIKYKDKSFFVEGFYADSSFFTMFSFDLIKGNSQLVLKDPGSIVISEKLAKKYFQDEDPIGKSLMFGDMGNRVLKVTGVFKNVPVNSTLKFDYVTTIEGYLAGKPWLQDWGSYVFKAYIQLSPKASISTVNSKIRQILQKNGSVKFELFIYPFSKLHVGSGLDYKEYHSNGNAGLLKLLFGIALLVLSIACLNFMNLAIAISLRRTREVGIKKIIGSNRMKLIWQFLGESFLMSIIALFVTLIIVETFLPSLNAFFSSTIDINYTNPWFIGINIFIYLFTAFFAGIYPAIFLSSYKPITILKGTRGDKNVNGLIRHILVIFQFTASITLIICTLSINRQINYIQNKQLGFDKEHIINFGTYSGIWPRRDVFKRELQKIQGIESVTYSDQNPISVQELTQDFKWKGKSADDDRWFSLINTDIDFLKTLKLQIIKGRDFSEHYSDRTNTCIINETAAKAMGLKDPIDESVSLWQNTGKIVGVVKDFHFNDLYQPIHPLVIRIWTDYLSNVFVRIKPHETVATIKRIRDLYQKYEPDYPFVYKFENNQFDDMYQDNIYFIGKMSGIFSIFTIVIACLGLFGLTSFTAELRTKEIGIRKVNGAKTLEIILMLSKDFTKWVAIAFVIACLIAYFAMNKWLQNFAYKTTMSWWIYVLAGLIAFIIALVSVSWQSWRAANRNPVEALRYE